MKNLRSGKYIKMARDNYKVLIVNLFAFWFKGKKCEPLIATFDVTLYKDDKNINIVQPDIQVFLF